MQVYVLLVLCVLFWSANFVLGRFVAGAIEPWELAFFRWLGVFVVTLPFLLLHVKKIWRALREHFGILVVLSALGIAAFNTLLYIGLQKTTATNALLINSSIPIIIVLLSFVILKTRISKLQVSGILLSTLGVIFLVLKGDVQSILTLSFNSGDFWVIASSLCWASYSVLVKFRPSSLSNFEFFITTVSLGLVMLLPFYLAQGYTWEREVMILTHYTWVIAYVVLFTSILCYYLWHYGIAHIGAGKTGQFTHLMPLFGSFLAYLFLGERLEWYHLGGILLIFGGIYLCLFVKKKC
ncbi:permease of the drug/metabolite transporter (DMT) superfamily [Sulfurospirillum diekertiae]|uniref:Permease of the drug/metabolite transporter (DMT) superfamily n=1 Tax=Sulfurospirillum diekertiae TaxID=1854492 RepID=A0A290HG04_9BACT|nr:DMT family transporter [Sulfurospirillum diekertiae]ATB70357.1 permease of the drug/metabolite transporter (DMT) superfamily [Sulfurospirillum diekertiae]